MKFLTRRASRPDSGGWTASPSIAKRSTRLSRLLAERGSLTAALQRHGATSVMLLRQQSLLPVTDEFRLMGVRSRRRMMVREVVLSVSGSPWVFAHTVANLAGVRMLKRAGRRPLGAILFADPKVLPKTLHYKDIDIRHPLFALAGKWSEEIPLHFSARRALFDLGPARLLVTEVFLSSAN